MPFCVPANAAEEILKLKHNLKKKYEYYKIYIFFK